MSGSVSGAGNSFASFRSAMAGPSALEGLARGEEASLLQEAQAGKSKFADNSGGRVEIAKG